MGFCHRTGSDLLLFVLCNKVAKSTYCPVIIFCLDAWLTLEARGLLTLSIGGTVSWTTSTKVDGYMVPGIVVVDRLHAEVTAGTVTVGCVHNCWGKLKDPRCN